MDEAYISVIAWVGFSGRASGGEACHAGHVPVRYTSLRPRRPKSQSGQALYRTTSEIFSWGNGRTSLLSRLTSRRS